MTRRKKKNSSCDVNFHRTFFTWGQLCLPICIWSFYKFEDVCQTLAQVQGFPIFRNGKPYHMPSYNQPMLFPNLSYSYTVSPYQLIIDTWSNFLIHHYKIFGEPVFVSLLQQRGGEQTTWIHLIYWRNYFFVGHIFKRNISYK